MESGIFIKLFELTFRFFNLKSSPLAFGNVSMLLKSKKIMIIEPKDLIPIFASYF